MSVASNPVSDQHPRIVLGADPGPVVELLAVGATVHRVEATGRDGVRRNLVLHHAGGAPPAGSTDYLGPVVGRYANRIAGGRIEVDGRSHDLLTNDGSSTLHGGPDGFDRRTWELVARDERSARFRLVSPDGDQGFPGEVVAEAAYELLADGWALTLTATTDAPTVLNLTQHGYAVLDGSGSVDDHVITVPADRYLPVDEAGLPTGDPVEVDRTRFDLRGGRRLGDVGALDHGFVVPGRGLRTVAVLESPLTGTRLTVRSDQPSVQVYTGDALTSHPRRAGVALEPQLLADSPHHPGWPSAVLRPGETYRHRLEWRVS